MSKKKVRKIERTPRYEQMWHTEGQIIELGYEFKEWCRISSEDPKSRNFVIERFWLDHNLDPTTPYRWAQKYPEFKHYYDAGKAYIACKKLEGVYLRELEPNKTTFTIHSLLDSWKASEEYHAKLKKESNNVLAALLGETFSLPELEGDQSHKKDTE